MVEELETEEGFVHSLNLTKSGKSCIIRNINGSERLVNRITSIGLTMGSRIEVIRNQPKYPVLIYCRDTLVAINLKEAEKIFVEVVA